MKYILFILIFIFSSVVYINSQVTIGSSTPPENYSVLQIDTDKTKGGLRMPQLTRDERDNLNTGLALDTATSKGLMIYNKTDNSIDFWDGKQWFSSKGGQTFVNIPRNEGNIRIDFGTNPITSEKEKPTYSYKSGGEEITIEYNRPLTMGLAFWPENLNDTVGDDRILLKGSNDRFLENNVPGQVHIWRLILFYDKGTKSTQSLTLRLYNPSPRSSFDQEQTLTIIEPTGLVSFMFISIADDYSIPIYLGGRQAEAGGYKFSVRANSDIQKLRVESIARISLYKD